MVAALGSGSASFAQVAGGFAPITLHAAHAQDAQLLRLLGDMARSVGTEGFTRQQTTAMNRQDGREVLRTLHCPALVLCGREDQITPPALSEEMASLLPGEVDLVLVPQSGHMSTLEQPAAVVEAFTRWIARVDAGAASADAR
ncbi:alpha/beta fold hydrolase [Variovorax sp. E3]|uniref:alpha/beta fold hydrolase n=1 Tax=Variovorax sp. E3 TaxID=1914993 RepID=UPI0022B6C1BC|nr:alpha/beta hydrolase [Variovorax sp. E3]